MIIKQDVIAGYIKNFLVETESKNRAMYLTRKQREGYQPRFYPSSISRCAREIVYDMLQYPRPPASAKLLMICENGDMMHLRYQKWLADAGVLLHSEYPLKVPEYRISGKVDAIIDPASIIPEMDGELCVVEFKSSNNKKFTDMEFKSEPQQEYVEQLMLYLHFLEIPYGVVIVENKDNQDVLEFWVEYDEKMAKRLIEKVKMINDHVDRKELPPRPYSSPNYHSCKWCDFKGICWGS